MRVVGDVPSAVRLVVVAEGARQIWFESNSGEVDGVAIEAVCVFGPSSVTRWCDVALALGLVAFWGSCAEEKKLVHNLGSRREDEQCMVRKFGTLNKVYGLGSINN